MTTCSDVADLCLLISEKIIVACAKLEKTSEDVVCYVRILYLPNSECFWKVSKPKFPKHQTKSIVTQCMIIIYWRQILYSVVLCQYEWKTILPVTAWIEKLYRLGIHVRKGKGQGIHNYFCFFGKKIFSGNSHSLVLHVSSFNKIGKDVSSLSPI